LIPLTSSSSNEPISNASAAFTSPLGGTSGGGYCITIKRRPTVQSLPDSYYKIWQIT